MKTNEKPRKVIRGGELEESAFGIAQEDQHHILSILRDKLYSDKILAVIREYTTNAVDAHVEVGKKDLPIQVVLPTRLNPNLRIRDFGPGLSEEDIRNIYAMYGRSTKRNTNEATGQLGLGCKSGFAYGDQFMITSWHEGKKTIYSAYLDETNVGAIAKMGEEDSNEPEGIEIQIAVAADDVHHFHRKAARLFSFFGTKPDVKNLNPELGQIEEFKYWLEGELDNGVKWGLQEKNSKPIAVMGNIPYEIDGSQFDFGDRGNYVLDHGVHIWFRIGDLQMAANREALEYNDKTKKHIKLVIKNVVDRIASEVTKKLQGAKSFKDATIAFNRLTQESVFKHFAQNTPATWNGRDIDGKILVIPGRPEPKNRNRHNYYNPVIKMEYDPSRDPFRIQECFLSKKWKGGHYVWDLSVEDEDFIKPDEDTTIFEMDTSVKWRIKMEYWQSQQAQQPGARTRNRGTYVVTFTSDKDRAQAFKDWDLADWNIVKISDMDEPPVDFRPSDGPTMSKREKKKHTRKTFELKDDFQRNPDRKSDNWKIVDVDIDDDSETRFYVKIDHFFPEMWNSRSSYMVLERLIGMVPKLGLKVDTLYGLKPDYIKKVKDKDHWKPIDEVTLEAALKQKTKLLRLIARDESLRAAPNSLRPYSKHVDRFPKGSPIRELLEFYLGLQQHATSVEVDNDIVMLLKWGGHNLKREAAEELDRLLDAVRARYPLLSEFRIFPDGFHHSLDDGQLSAVVNYVRIIEREQAMEVQEDDF